MKLKSQTIDLGLSGYDELFMTEQERADTRKPKVEEIPLTELTPFKNHPFKVKNDAEMAELMKSIADAGVLSPAMARPKEGGGYELISGHRRLAACKALGMDTMPVIVRKLTDEEAVINPELTGNAVKTDAGNSATWRREAVYTLIQRERMVREAL